MDRDLAACQAILERGSRSFWAASRLLPPRVRGPAAAVYAFCRIADDAVDEAGARAEALEAQRLRLDRAYAGRPTPHPVERALAAVVREHDIPRAIPEALLEGFGWDLEGRRYRTLEELYAYCARVASTVGVMMTLLMGRREARTLARACDLGVAMQLTNIARDVGEDARAGRLYLPLIWLGEVGIEPEAWLGAPRFSEALGRVVRRLLGVAAALYQRADAGIALLPADCRMAIRAARLIYAEIGAEIRGAGYDSVTRRAVTTTRRKLALLTRAAAAATWRPKRSDAPPLAQTRFLVEAVTGSSADAGASP